MTCAACGAPVTGRFCSHCGAAADVAACPACRVRLAPGARFCHRCGSPIQGTGRFPRRERTAWIAAGVAVVALVLVVLWRGGSFRPAGAPDMANPGNALAGRAPDIRTMSPDERFERLWDRVIRAAEGGDTNTVTQFAPMALGAYAQLGTANTDQRFHAALIQVAIGNFPAARALADTILAQSPGHLFGYVIRGEVADRLNQAPALNQSFRDFLDHYDAEMQAGRPEYTDHKPLLDDFRTRARGAVNRER